MTQKWDNLTGQLRDRCDWIDQAIVKSTQYQSLLRSLSGTLTELDEKLSSSLTSGTLPDAVNQQLEAAQRLKQEIEQQTPKIKEAQTLCEDLSALVREEYLRAELSRQLEGVLKSFKDIEQKTGWPLFFYTYLLVRNQRPGLAVSELLVIIRDCKGTLPQRALVHGQQFCGSVDVLHG